MIKFIITPFLILLVIWGVFANKEYGKKVTKYRKILRTLDRVSKISVAETAKLLEVDEPTAQKYLNDLVKMKSIKVIDEPDSYIKVTN